jgi:imidazole glycerol-phosphate synthase subunit HisH
MKTVLVDYGLGNLRSVRKALESVGAHVIQTSDPEIILMGDKVILPGVGAFKDGMQGLKHRGLIPALNEIVNRKTPLLGICLGMQLCFMSSTEMGNNAGLGYVQGEVRKFSGQGLKIPHTGWNQLKINLTSSLFQGVGNNPYVYFNHSYYCAPDEPTVTIAETEYGVSFASAIQCGTIYGVQFHPEKSQDAGLKLLSNFLEYCQ